MSGTITKLEVQKKNKERVNVHLDEAYAFALDIMAAALLRRGQFLSDAEIADLQDEDTRKRAYFYGVRLLGNRPRSRSEIEQKMRQKEYAPDVIESALARLEREGLVDDAEFARYWSENRTQFRPRSARALRFELRQKGVSNEDMNEAVGALDEDEAALAALISRSHTWQRLSAEDAREKAMGFLARRGFSYEVSNRAWKHFLETSADS
jgi:regulatory protein